MNIAIKKLNLHISNLISQVFIVLCITIIVFFFTSEIVEVSGQSMQPALYDKEKLLVLKYSSLTDKPKRFDIVIAKDPQTIDKLIIKRVVGLPKETVSTIGKDTYINNRLIDMSGRQITQKELQSEILAYNIRPDSYFLLGDNSDHSTDSRVFGDIQEEKINGKAIFVIYPLENIRQIQ